MKTVYLLGHGASLDILEQNIERFRYHNVLWATVNQTVEIENRILGKINQAFDILYWSDPAEHNYISNQIIEFFQRDYPITFITSPLTIKHIRKFCKNGNIIISSFAMGYNQVYEKPFYNSITALTLTLISLGFRDFVWFGTDQGGEYYDGRKERCGKQVSDIKKVLVRDGQTINRRLWSEIKKITSDEVNIKMVSPNSTITVIQKVGIDEL